jgi:hypothetical protein
VCGLRQVENGGERLFVKKVKKDKATGWHPSPFQQRPRLNFYTLEYLFFGILQPATLVMVTDYRLVPYDWTFGAEQVDHSTA